MRDFEKGDLVTGHTIYRPAIKTTAIVRKITNFDDGQQNVHVECDGIYLSCEEFIVKHIRKPRPGSKDARDIVAMLGREYHNELLKFWWFVKDDKAKLSEYWEDRYFELLATKYKDRFQKAKSMLVR